MFPPGTAKVATLVKFFIVEKPRHGADSVKIVLQTSKTGRSSVAASQYQIQDTCLQGEISPDNQDARKLLSRINFPNLLQIPNTQKQSYRPTSYSRFLLKYDFYCNLPSSRNALNFNVLQLGFLAKEAETVRETHDKNILNLKDVTLCEIK